MKKENRQRRIAIKRVSVELHGRLYSVMFRRHYRDDEFGRTKQPLIDTECVVSSVDQSKAGREKYNQITDGIAKQSHLDRYNKLFGLKLAFTRAIQEMSKPDRTIFWKEWLAVYMERVLIEQPA